ncbi:proprotein convertase subtilisin/kexin type 5-like isoform X2 [Lytechinus variegatus]|uniref:proprotein convertase subtilisin/kexin type 5-like isoform X2 n=1 Tax=Lytechinus variegatus TaxID=7654 RepID=UPI001BB291B3|nr:proprotein convertase subtilisin/kexin type 5-like isoform X2 [Lytechinus variegatus]
MSKTVVKNREKHSFMMASWRTCATLAAFTLVVVCFWCVIAEEVFTHHFALIVRGGQTKADRLAEKYGYINHGQIGALEDHYLFSHKNVFKRSAEASTGDHIDIADEPEVEWFEQQVSRKRVKRDMTRFSDPLWPNQWYLDGNFSGDSKPIASMNIQQAWDKGYTGAGIVITIMDDGLEYTHTDIRNSYDAAASYDFVSRDADAMPRYMRAPNPEENMHGTRCAGEIVMQPNNSKCGVGIAYNAQIGGIRMLDGLVTDEMEASSLSFNYQHVDIYSASWGPDDEGFTVEGPNSLAKKALEKGVKLGRDGKGSIFVWASGNGGMHLDDCNADGYANSIYTLVVSSTTENQDKPFYSEHCAASLASTFSSGNKQQKMVVTTDLHDECIGNFTGTSASAPIAAGIVSLVLEANGNLTWRDVQYLVVVTSKRHQLTGDWMTNGAGYEVSHWFGFGLMDAAAMVEKAKTWENLPEQLTYSKFADNVNQGPRNRFFNRGPRYFTSSFEVQDCKDPFAGKPIRYLEHVQVTLSLKASVRGKVKVELTSPSGTTSTLLSNRTNDVAGKGFRLWTLMTVHFWGEDPNGAWLIKIGNGEYNRLMVSTVRLTLRGTSSLPASLLPSHTTDTLEHVETEQEEREHQGAELPLDPQRPSGRRPQISPLRVVSETLQRDVRAASSSYSWDSSWWWSSSDWESYQQCHEECLYGCSGPNADECYKCRHYKDRETLDCVATCPDGQFTPPELHIRCGRCSEHCKTCSGNTKHDCLSCPPGLFLSDDNSCVRECPHGYYKDSFFQMCRQCSPLCRSCEANENSCTSCIDGAVLRGSQCITRCMDSEYMVNERCLPCHSSCFSCNGGTETDCTSCFDDYVHMDMRCVEPQQCGVGYYIVNSYDAASRQCLRCHSTCKDCQGPSFTDCVDCHQGFFLVGGACLQTCENGKYLAPDNNCKSCSEGCVLCSDDRTCIQCAKSKVLHQQDGSIICREGCEEGTYSMEGECFSCHSSCETCNGGGIMDCTRCKQLGGETYYLLEGACVHYCPAGYFKYDRDSSLIHTCELCDDSCKTCTGSGIDECIDCEDGLEKQGARCLEPSSFTCDVENCDECLNGNNVCQLCITGFYLDGGTCEGGCPDGKVPISNTRQCELCHPTCRTCAVSPDQCTSCNTGYFLDDLDSLCLTQCPEDTYVNQDNECILCDDKCASCVGPGPTQCTICYEMDEFLSGTSCVRDCPVGQYGDEYTGTCRRCHPSCVTCAGPGDHECNSCRENFQLELGFCQSSCSDKFYKGSNGDCHACHETCQTCTGSGNSDCLSCDYYKFLSPAHACVTDCPSEYYPDYESNVCRKCDSSCLTCLDSGPGDCIECSLDTYMLLRDGQLCVKVCPEGYYESTELGFRDCRQCSVECRDCHGSYLNCVSCFDGTYLFQGRCFSTCPSGYTEDDESNHCIQHANICPLYCETCDDWGDCTVCQDEYIVYFGECVKESDMACPINQFIVSFNAEGTATCAPCDPTCGTCLGPEPTDCVTCVSEDYHFQGSRCVQDCEPGKYKDDILKECYDCHPTCQTCDAGSSLDCTSCIDGMELSQTNSHGMCQFGCPQGTYLSDNVCTPCEDRNCFTCFMHEEQGTTQNKCLTCDLGYFLTGTGNCVKNCPEHTYEYILEDAIEGNECRSCHESCVSCNGPGPNSCTSCFDEMVLARGECMWDCQEGYYPDEQNQCQRCHETCQTCLGGEYTDCMSCRIDKVLLDNTCVNECGDGYFLMTEDIPLCQECDELCLNCTDYGPFDCAACHPNYELDNGVCYNRCGSGRYYNKESETCGVCDEKCGECFGPSPDQCISCKGQLRLEKIGRNKSQCIPCCSAAEEGEECCKKCTGDSHKCPNSYVEKPTVVAGVKVQHIGTIVFSVMLVIVLFFLVFGLLQARSHGKLCWRHKYAKVPSMNFSNKDKYVTLGKPDDDYYEDEEDIYGDVSEDDDDLEEPDTFQTVGVGYRGQDRNGVIDHL